MFRSAAAVQTEAAERKLAAFRDHWKRTADQWFDGTAESVEKRIAKLDQVLAFAGETAKLQGTRVGSFCLAALPNLKASRAELVDLRQHMAGGHWFPGGDEEASRFNVDPRMYPSMRDWMDASNLGSHLQNAVDNHPPAGHDPRAGDYAVDERWRSPYATASADQLRHAAAEFLDDQNTSDRHELLVRAQRLVEARTSTWSAEASSRAVRDFVAAVEGQIPRPTRTAASAGVPTYIQDFEDHLMFS